VRGARSAKTGLSYWEMRIDPKGISYEGSSVESDRSE
jgi:hypothetical protein